MRPLRIGAPLFGTLGGAAGVVEVRQAHEAYRDAPSPREIRERARLGQPARGALVRDGAGAPAA